MGTLEHSVWIKARLEDIWNIYIDPSRLPEWQTGTPEARKELANLKALIEREVQEPPDQDQPLHS